MIKNPRLTNNIVNGLQEICNWITVDIESIIDWDDNKDPQTMKNMDLALNYIKNIIYNYNEKK